MKLIPMEKLPEDSTFSWDVVDRSSEVLKVNIALASFVFMFFTSIFEKKKYHEINYIPTAMSCYYFGFSKQKSQTVTTLIQILIPC